MNTNINELLDFNSACDELVAGKYILIDVKINSILATIERDDKLKNIVSDCVNAYNFVELFNSLVSSGSFVMPNDNKQVVAIVYNLFYRFKNKEIDFYEFLNAYFPNEENIDAQFAHFASNLVLAFKRAVGELFMQKHIIVDSAEYQSNYYNKIKTNISLILNNIDNYKLGLNDKDEFTMLLNSLHSASDKNDKTLVYSLMIALDYFTKYHKKARKAYLALEECFS